MDPGVALLDAVLTNGFIGRPDRDLVQVGTFLWHFFIRKAKRIFIPFFYI